MIPRDSSFRLKFPPATRIQTLPLLEGSTTSSRHLLDRAWPSHSGTSLLVAWTEISKTGICSICAGSSTQTCLES